jgi:predicted DCC family thiol-disulfide oxidoreductase YuxK
MIDESKTILLYDATCGFCDYTVKFILKHEKEGEDKILFAALQSELGTKVVKQYQLENIDSVIILTKGNIYTKSKAVFKVAEYLRFPYSTLIIFKIFPQLLRDKVYDLIAKYRKRIMGEITECEIPSIENRKRFIA